MFLNARPHTLTLTMSVTVTHSNTLTRSQKQNKKVANQHARRHGAHRGGGSRGASRGLTLGGGRGNLRLGGCRPQGAARTEHSALNNRSCWEYVLSLPRGAHPSGPTSQTHCVDTNLPSKHTSQTHFMLSPAAPNCVTSGQPGHPPPHSTHTQTSQLRHA